MEAVRTFPPDFRSSLVILQTARLQFTAAVCWVVVCSIGISSQTAGLWCRLQRGRAPRSPSQGCWEAPSHCFQASEKIHTHYTQTEKSTHASLNTLLTLQSTGVATRLCAVNCNESMTRRISSKFRPVVAG